MSHNHAFAHGDRPGAAAPHNTEDRMSHNHAFAHGDRPGADAPDRRREYPLAQPIRLGLGGFARRAGLHPDLVRRFVALGLLDARRDATGQLWFTPQQLLTVSRIQRLRTGLPVNYAAIGLILDLLDEIESLEAALRRTGGRGRPPWT
jgi:chaperone modulatory protein CbpM